MLCGKEFKAECGLMKPIEFHCGQKEWNCKKCIDIKEFLIKSLEIELGVTIAQSVRNTKRISNLVNLREGLEKETDIIKYFWKEG
jgi:hypothetical protein